MIKIRTIEKKDNVILASIIRESLEAHDLARPGTVYTDPTTDQLFKLFQTEGSVYFVAEAESGVLGGCGIFPTKGLPQGHAELVKLYLREEARGKKLGFALMSKSLEWALKNGYTHVYLETFAELSSAVGLYKKLGFQDLDAPMGDSGHHACQIWMLKKLPQFQTEVFSSSSPLYETSMMIRKNVFVDEQKINVGLEVDEFEDRCLYFLTSLDDRPVSTGRLRPAGEKIKFERIATLKEFRGKGAAEKLMAKMLEAARSEFPGKIPWMHAQMSAVGFYEKIGWKRTGVEFTEADIPHIAMTI